MLNDHRIYRDSTGVSWVIFKRRAGRFEVYPEDKGPNCIEADVTFTLKDAKELIEHMATANETERAMWTRPQSH